jgi:hypothetical protein
MSAPLNVSKFIHRQGPGRVLTVLLEWPKIDTRNKHAVIRKLMVVVLTRLVSSPAGKAAFVRYSSF